MVETRAARRMAESKPTFQIDKLKKDCENFSTWRVAVSMHLRFRDLWEITSGKINVTTDNCKADQEACMIIYNSIVQEEQAKCGLFKSAHELWQKLEENAQGATNYSKAQAQRELYQFTIKKGRISTELLWTI